MKTLVLTLPDPQSEAAIKAFLARHPNIVIDQWYKKINNLSEVEQKTSEMNKKAQVTSRIEKSQKPNHEKLADILRSYLSKNTFKNKDVIEVISKYGLRINRRTLGTMLIGGSINHTSRHHYHSYNTNDYWHLGRGLYRLATEEEKKQAERTA